MVSTLVLIYFGSTLFGNAMNTTCIPFQTVDQEKHAVLIF